MEEKLNESESDIKVVNQQSLKAINRTNANCQFTKYLPSNANYIANNLSELRNLIGSTSVADNSIIYLADAGNFDLSVTNSSSIEINRPLKIVSGRNVDNTNGAVIFSNIQLDSKLFVIRSNNVTLSGLKIIGYDTQVGQFPYSPGISSGVSINGYDNLIIENCEISGWSYAGVELVNSKNNIINNNYIHHNRRTGLGYGVAIHNTNDIPTNALVTCNYFEFNRHDIAGSGSKNQEYEASYNIIGEAGVLTHRFDMHGKNNGTEEIAGTHISIHDNQFLFDEDYAIRIGGITENGVEIYNNTFKHKCEILAIEQRKFNVVLNRENWVGINSNNNSYLNTNVSNIDFSNLFLFKNFNNEVVKYSFGNECNCSNLSGIVGHGFNDYLKFLVGNWTGDGTDDLIALRNNGDLILSRFNNGTFYGQSGGGVAGSGFNNVREFLVGNWVGDNKDELIVLTNSGDLLLYTLNNGIFQGGVIVGNGFNGYSKFLVGNWTGASDGTEDLIALSNSGDLVLYPFNNNTFYGQGGPLYVGNGFNGYKKFFVGRWNNDDIDDLVALSNDDDLILYPFRHNTFYGQGGPIYIGSGFANFKDFIVARLPNRVNDDLIAINNSNQLYLYYLQGNYLGNVKYIGCVKEYNLILNGKWMSGN